MKVSCLIYGNKQIITLPQTIKFKKARITKFYFLEGLNNCQFISLCIDGINQNYNIDLNYRHYFLILPLSGIQNNFIQYLNYQNWDYENEEEKDLSDIKITVEIDNEHLKTGYFFNSTTQGLIEIEFM